MPTLKINGKEVTVPAGTSVFNACKQAGVFVPNYCYHPGLSVAGNCRICQVEIKGQPKPAISCNTPCADAMEVFTDSPKAVKARKGVMEFLLINHPLDCPTCDQAGECDLQNFAAKENQLQSRFDEEKVLKERVNLGPHVQYVPNRCILCSRCVRFCDEISGSSALGIVQRGTHAEIAVAPGTQLDDEMASNVVDVCPVGALLTREHLHEWRSWFLKRTPTTCPSCSRGCSMTADAFRDTLVRQRPRHNPKVNDWWMCDTGRYAFGFVHADDRVATPLKRGPTGLVETSWEEALDLAAKGLEAARGRGPVAAVGSAWSTSEESLLLAEAAARWGGRPGAFLALADGKAATFKKGFVIDADKNPNRRGARAALGIDEAASAAFWRRAAESGVAGLLLLDTAPGLAPSDAERQGWEKAGFRVALSMRRSALTETADVVLPVGSFAETEGTFVNSQGHVQWIRPAIRPVGGAREAWKVLALLAGAKASGIRQIHARLPAPLKDMPASGQAVAGA